MFKNSIFSEKAVINATYRTTGNIYYRIVGITATNVRVEEMTAQGGTNKFANYSPALFESLFRNNCTWARFALNPKTGMYADAGRGAALRMGLDRYLAKS